MDNIEDMNKIKKACRDCPKDNCWWGGFVGDCPFNKEKRKMGNESD